MTTRRKKIRLFLLLWHRRIGAFIAIFLLVLAGSGLLLNHTGFLGLSNLPVTNSWVLNLYGVKQPKVVSFRVHGHWLTHLGGNHLYFDEQEISFCQSPYVGASVVNEFIVAVCRDNLLVLTTNGDIVEQLGTSYGLPKNIQSLSSRDGHLHIKTPNQWYAVDLELMQFVPLQPNEAIRDPIPSATLPPSIESSLVTQFHGETINLERVLLDMHSGRLFGLTGVIWTDLVAIALLWVASTGVWTWATRRQ